MKKNKKIITIIFTFFIAMIVSISSVNAATNAVMNYSGPGEVNTGETFTLDIVATNIVGANLMGAGGKVTITDPSCVQFVSLQKVASGTAHNDMFAYSDMDGTSENFTIARATFKAGTSTCTTTVNIEQPKLAFTDGAKVSPQTITKNIKVGTPAPAKSSDNTLKSLTPDKGTLSPAFNPTQNSYNIEVGSDVNKINFNAVVNDPKAAIKSGTTCNLTGASTTCKIVVKAENGSEKTYNVTVKKSTTGDNTDPDNPDGPVDPDEPDGPVDPDGPDNPDDPVKPDEPTDKKSNDATLKSLDISGFTLYPSFKKNTTSYAITVNNNITALDVTAIPTDPKATVKVSGNSNWKEGINPVVITVIAEDGTTKTYIINVTRKSLGGGKVDVENPKDGNNYLEDIEVTDGKLSPQFDKEETEYNITVPNSVTKLNLEPIKSSDKAKVSVSGNSNFQVDKINVVTIKVTAEDGSIRIYTINVTRSDKDGDNKLDKLVINNGDIDPEFDPDINRYIVEVGPNDDDIDIDAIPHNPNSKVEIIGGTNLKEGNNKVRVIVTDENGLSRVYYLNVYKKGAKKFLGLTLGGWLALLGGLLLLGLLLFIIFALLKKKKEPEEEKENKAPVIEFKPEFNFGSKNGTDDDIVEKGGVLNQYTGTALPEQPAHLPIPEAKASIKDASSEEIYDPYDDVVTKDELFDAIEEAKATKDVNKLKLLYEQELLNRKKAELKSREKNRRYKG